MFIFVAIFLWGAVVYFQERTPPRDATEVYVVAKQWMWKLQHAEGQREINELHVPVGRDIKLIMTSQDVIHSFYIPAFRIKQDVFPGRYTFALVPRHQARHLSSILRGILRHAAFRHGRPIVVMEPAQYEAWLNGGSPAPLSGTGRAGFSPARLRHLPPLRHARPRPQSRRSLRQAG